MIFFIDEREDKSHKEKKKKLRRKWDNNIKKDLKKVGREGFGLYLSDPG